MTDQELQMLENYALGVLNLEQSQRAEQLIDAMSNSERKIWIEIQRGVELIPYSLQSETPPLHIKQVVMERIAGHRINERRVYPTLFSFNMPIAWSSMAASCAIFFLCFCTGILMDKTLLKENALKTNLQVSADPFGLSNAGWFKKQKPRLRFASLTATADRSQRDPRDNIGKANNAPYPDPHYVLYVDPLCNQMHIYALGLPSSSERCEYGVWVSATNGEQIASGKLQILRAGIACAILEFHSAQYSQSQLLHVKVVKHCDESLASETDRTTLDTDFQLKAL